MKTVDLLAMAPLAIYMAGTGCATRPGAAAASQSLGFPSAVAAVAGATAGAAIGGAHGGTRAAAIGAVLGGTVGGLGTAAVVNTMNRGTEAAERQGEQKATARVMNDMWASQLSKPPGQGSGGQRNGRKTITYPAGVYDGVLYGPREVEVPGDEGGGQ